MTAAKSSTARVQDAVRLDHDDRPQHPRFQVPFTVIVDGRTYEGVTIALTGMSVIGLADPSSLGRTRDIVIHFPFVGIDVGIKARVTVTELSNSTGHMKLVFADAMGPQREHLQNIFNTYIAGDLTPIPALIGGDGRPKIAKGETAQRRSARAMRVVAGTAKAIVAGGLGLLLAAFVGSKVYERAFVSHPPGLSYIAADSISLGSTSAGQVTFINAQAKNGEPAFAVRSQDGRIATIDMPCDCLIVGQAVQVGDTVAPGRPILEAVPKTSDVYIATQADEATLRALYRGATLEVVFKDGTVSPATVRRLPLIGELTANQGGQVRVTLRPDRPLQLSDVGLPVDITIDSFEPFYASSLRALGSLWSTAK